MTEVVSKAVAEGIREIKSSGRCNMNDVATVAKIAIELKHIELSELIMSDEDKYRRCLVHGCVVQEEVEIKEKTSDVTKASPPTKSTLKKSSSSKKKG